MTYVECEDHKEFHEQGDQDDGPGTTIQHTRSHAKEVIYKLLGSAQVWTNINHVVG